MLLGSAWLLSGCATTHYPIKLDPAFEEKNVRTIALLPVVDRRRDRSIEIDLEYEINARATKQLTRRGYNVLQVPVSLLDEAGNFDAILDMESTYLATLGPAEADAVMAIYVDDVFSSYKVFSYVFKIDVLGTLVDKRDGTELWRDKGIGNFGQAGLISGITSGLNRNSALDGCVLAMLQGLPKLKMADQTHQSEK